VGAVPRVSLWENEASGDPAHYEPMLYHLEVDSENKAEERFLHVLQGSDAGAQPLVTNLVTITDGGYEGAVVGTTLALFPVHTNAQVNTLTYNVSATLTTHIITGLMPNTAYDVTLTPNGDIVTVAIASGTALISDSAGVLVIQAH
jgi:hypothetical protein